MRSPRTLACTVFLMTCVCASAAGQYPVDRSVRLYGQAGYDIPGAPQVFEQLWNLGVTTSVGLGIPATDRIMLRPGLSLSRFGLNRGLARSYLYEPADEIEGGIYRALTVHVDALIFLAPASTTLNLYGIAGGGYYSGGLGTIGPGELELLSAWTDAAGGAVRARAGLGLQLRVTDRLSTFFEWNLDGGFAGATTILHAAGTTGIAFRLSGSESSRTNR